MVTKTSLMLGLGETDDQIMKVMEGEIQCGAMVCLSKVGYRGGGSSTVCVTFLSLMSNELRQKLTQIRFIL